LCAYLDTVWHKYLCVKFYSRVAKIALLTAARPMAMDRFGDEVDTKIDTTERAADATAGQTMLLRFIKNFTFLVGFDCPLWTGSSA